MRSRLITARPPGERYVIEWPSYKRLCEGDQVAAKLLEQFDWLTRCAMENEDTDEPQPFSRSRKELYRDLNESHGEKQIEQALTYLEGRGFVSVDATNGSKRQITLHPDRVNLSLLNLSQTAQVEQPVSNDTGTCLKRDNSDLIYVKTSKDLVSTPSASDDDPWELYRDGSGWLMDALRRIGKTVKIKTDNVREVFDVALDGDLDDAVERRQHLLESLAALPDKNVTDKAKIICLGYNAGRGFHKNKTRPGNKGRDGDPSVNSTKPKYDKYAIAAEVIANFTEDDLK